MLDGPKHNDAYLPEARQEQCWRIYALMILFVLGLVAVSARLFIIQVKDAAIYKELAIRQYESKVPLKATRGHIFDRQMNLLVSNSIGVTFAADPHIVKDAKVVAEEFSSVFGTAVDYYMERLSQETKYVVLEKTATPVQVKQLEPWSYEGVIKLNDPKRLYHYGSVAGQVLGFVSADDTGRSGMELALNEELAGKEGYVIMQRDGLGRCRPSADYPRIEPTNGISVVLTIDLVYQSIAEEELAKGVEKYEAEAGLAVIMSPKTGEVLAMVNYPSFDPNNFSQYEQRDNRNRVVTDMFEPGSTFKIVAASAALEEGKKTVGDSIFAEWGVYKTKQRTIRDDHPHGWLTFKRAVAFSSNICMAKVADGLGAELFYKYARNFGFGIATGIEFPGEARGELKKPVEWSGATLNTMAFGYELAVTAIQMASAYCGIANKGVMMRPHLIKKEIDEAGNVVKEAQPQVVRRVVSERTAAIMTECFSDVVEEGTGVAAHIDGIKIAGKTGTARKLENGRYTNRYSASFVGYFPADDPQIVCFVLLDSPQRGCTGGKVAAPIFRNIAERIINTSGLLIKRREENFLEANSQESIAVPDVCQLRVEMAEKVLENRGLKTERLTDRSTLAASAIVVRQSPEPGAKLEKNGVVRLMILTDEEAPADGYIVLPDVRETSLRRAVNRLTVGGIEAIALGTGIVVSQSPFPGEQVKFGARCTLYCKPRSIESASLH